MMHTFVSAVSALALFVSARALAVAPHELRNGDILLQPLNCYLCNAVEKVERSIYSHSGIVVVDSNRSVFVLESIGGENVVPLASFLARTQKNQKVRVVRPLEFVERPLSARSMISEFQANFVPVVFDSAMRWDNVDASGREPLYCSEFVAKFLARFLVKPYATKTMRFDVGRIFWTQYFHGDVPDGQPGIAPSDFLKSPLSQDLGDLN